MQKQKKLKWFLKIYLQKNDLNTIKITFCVAVGCSIAVYITYPRYPQLERIINVRSNFRH